MNPVAQPCFQGKDFRIKGYVQNMRINEVEQVITRQAGHDNSFQFHARKFTLYVLRGSPGRIPTAHAVKGLAAAQVQGTEDGDIGIHGGVQQEGQQHHVAPGKHHGVAFGRIMPVRFPVLYQSFLVLRHGREPHLVQIALLVRKHQPGRLRNALPSAAFAPRVQNQGMGIGVLRANGIAGHTAGAAVQHG
ncbi:MAG: hypothetical protein BWX80_03609 [Candidatus Hydrogenedentes bacterium ADurb.Bin101]|nr:MAG: hypothetical protein BWX80_03609 [Candidatus Hydrogenedentes bacterium ADurb.Bin101]